MKVNDSALMPAPVVEGSEPSSAPASQLLRFRQATQSAPRERVKSAATLLPVYLTAQDVADVLKVDVATIYRWASSDASMPATRIHGTVRFESRALDRWLAGKTQRSRRA